jgi:hypothetical protein
MCWLAGMGMSGTDWCLAQVAEDPAEQEEEGSESDGDTDEASPAGQAHGGDSAVGTQ